jgi:type IV pilus assembly protein PilN
MYSIDINFLKERPEFQDVGSESFSAAATNPKGKSVNKIPLFAGGAFAALLLAATGGLWLWTGAESGRLQAKQEELDRQLGNLKQQETRLAGLKGEIASIENNVTTLGGVFDRIQPWSAILQDLRENAPPGVQIESLKKETTAPTAGAASAAPPPGVRDSRIPSNAFSRMTGDTSPSSPQPSATPSSLPIATSPTTLTSLPDMPLTTLTITGYARTYEDVNQFLLTLKRSPFGLPEKTNIILANMVANPAQPTIREDLAGGNNSSNNTGIATRFIMPKVVKYEIKFALRSAPASELAAELERKGAVGLVTRLRALQASSNGQIPIAVPSPTASATPSASPSAKPSQTPNQR